MIKTIPHCDIATGKIYGCEPGSKSWYHEQGHLEFNNLETTSRLILYRDYINTIWIISITLSIISKLLLILSIPAMLFLVVVQIYEEKWCDRYAIEQLEKAAGKTRH